MSDITQEIILSGSIKTGETLSGTLNTQATLSAGVYIPEIVDLGEPYEGEYTVVPEFATQVLPTANKRMQDDVTVHAIPYYEVTNPTGGTPVYIGMEVDIDG